MQAAVLSEHRQSRDAKRVGVRRGVEGCLSIDDSFVADLRRSRRRPLRATGLPHLGRKRQGGALIPHPHPDTGEAARDGASEKEVIEWDSPGGEAPDERGGS